jgi:hypothetical protein
LKLFEDYAMPELNATCSTKAFIQASFPASVQLQYFTPF